MSKKTIYLDVVCGFAVSAIVEDGKIIEHNFERAKHGNIIGNVYKGKVTNVLNGMQAAFINCGLERNCYISAADLFPDRNKYDCREADIPSTLNLKEGDEIMVQVVKAPVGKKGAKVTTHLSLIGKSAIYMPNTDFVGVSRKISDGELRKTLILTADKMKRRGEGLIVRTAAPYINRSYMQAELDHLRLFYEAIKEKFAASPVGTLLYTDDNLAMRILRDTLDFDTEKIVVGSKSLKDLVDSYFALCPPEGKKPVILQDSNRDMFYELGLSPQITAMLSPRVDLENGAYLVIEKTEALTVIDVNTGKFIGDDSLEQTVYQTNILAAREIARQVRLRNIGGIVVVDFIDMERANHRKALCEELQQALSADKAKCTVLPMSKFGLIEFTRKRIGTNPAALMTKPCKYCREAGYTKSAELVLFDMRAKLLDLLVEGNKTVFVDMNNEIAAKLFKWSDMVDDIKNRFPQARVYVVPHRTFHEEQMNFRCENGAFAIPEGTVLLY